MTGNQGSEIISKSSQKFDVSVIIPTFNCENTICKTIESIVNQFTKYSYEIIICDDASTDNTFNLLKTKYSRNKNFSLIQNKHNSGAAISRNNAISKSSGRFIMFCDADDLWSKEKIEKQISFMLTKQTPFSYTYYSVFEDDLAKRKLIRCKNEVNYKDLLYFNHICTSTVCYDKTFFGKQYMPDIRRRQDYALWLKMIKIKEKFHCLCEELMYKRIGFESISDNKFKLFKYNYEVLTKYEKLKPYQALYYLVILSLKKLVQILVR